MVMSKQKYFTDEERLAARREAVRRYNHSEKGKANEARRNHEKQLVVYARYRTTEGYATAQERRRVKDQANGWPIQTRQRKWLRANEPDKVNAWMAVRWAQILGLLTCPPECERCGSPKRLHAHHHNGYDRDHWLDVQWLCSPCHRTIHR